MDTAVLWVEGVNFRWAIYDTSDLSTVRGGSIAYLEFGTELFRYLDDQASVDAQVISSGASRVVLELKGTRDHIRANVNKALEELLRPDDIKSVSVDASRANGERRSAQFKPYSHLQFVHGLSFKGGMAGLNEAQSIARRSQFDRIGIAGLSSMEGDDACEIDKTRPADTEIHFASDDPFTPATTVLVSETVAARRHFGRTQRQAFYKSRLQENPLVREKLSGPDSVVFCDSFHEIVADPPEEISANVRNKLAIFYADGNKFGAISRSMNETDPVSGLKEFSSQLLKHQDKLLERALQLFLMNLTTEHEKHSFLIRKDTKKTRLETLLWGGDEVRFVLPAWLALSFATAFYEEIRNWQIGSIPLTFSTSLVIASYKTPIRQLVSFGEALVDDAKQHAPSSNNFSIEVLESLEPPASSIARWRSDCLGLNEPLEPGQFVLDGNQIGAVIPQLMALKESLPRSQLYKWLQVCKQTSWHPRSSAPLDEQEMEPLIESIDKYLAKAGASTGIISKDLQIPGRSLPVSLYLLTQLWDYLPANFTIGEADS